MTVKKKTEEYGTHFPSKYFTLDMEISFNSIVRDEAKNYMYE